MKIKYIVVFIVILLSGCATHPNRHLTVSFADRTTLAFIGKGAAAGMMMDAYLGGAGVAIGIAIDEGIAKNIAENITNSYPDFNILSAVKKELQLKSYRSMKPIKVEIISYGFRTASGEGDLAVAWLTIKVTNPDGEVAISYPQDFASPKTAGLSLVKSDAKVARSMLQQAVADVTMQWASKVHAKKM